MKYKFRCSWRKFLVSFSGASVSVLGLSSVVLAGSWTLAGTDSQGRTILVDAESIQRQGVFVSYIAGYSQGSQTLTWINGSCASGELTVKRVAVFVGGVAIRDTEQDGNLQRQFPKAFPQGSLEQLSLVTACKVQ